MCTNLVATLLAMWKSIFRFKSKYILIY